MRIAFKTFGCRANSGDTDALYLEAKRRGYEIVDEAARADAYVINSCTVTEAADRDARNSATRYKRSNPLSLVAVVGCYAQVAKDELLSLPEVDFVVGTANKFSILDYLKEASDKAEWNRDRVEPAKGFLPEKFAGSRYSRANVKIQDGCNFSCSFCIIPTARGRSKSLEMGTVLDQIDQAHAEGFEEVVLTGIHLAHYGWDRGTNLLSLLERILEKKKGPRIRLSTLDPFELPDELIAKVGKEPRLCPHFHIALQSGSDSVLKAMRRIYLAKEFIEVTNKIRDQHGDTFIGVDVIVGFPGETDEAFEETVSVLEKSFWAKLHVFPYSERAGTKAVEIKEKVSSAVQKRRVDRLLKLSEERYQAFLQSQSGKIACAILERPSRKNPDYWHGHTENYLPVLVRTKGVAKQSVAVKLGELADEKLFAEPV